MRCVYTQKSSLGSLSHMYYEKPTDCPVGCKNEDRVGNQTLGSSVGEKHYLRTFLMFETCIVYMFSKNIEKSTNRKIFIYLF
jgi:hypothetical protein